MLGGGRLALSAREEEVALAAADGSTTKAIAERLSLSPRTVEHHLSATYRKLGVANRAALVALLRPGPLEGLPQTRYAMNGDTHLAYQVIGDGPRDLVLVPGFVSNIEVAWTWPAHARFLRRLAAGRRLIVFDKSGTGLSDPVGDPSSLTLERRVEDIRAVMDAAGSEKATVFGFSEGAAMSMLFAATYPARTNGLILYGALISATPDPERSVFSDPAAARELMGRAWGTGRFLAPFVPSVAHDEAELAHVARFERHGASPAAAFTIFRLAAGIELRALCPMVHVSSLVLHRREDALVPVAHGRYLAEHLPAVRYVELEGRDHPPWIAASDRLFAEVDRFAGQDHPAVGGPMSVLRAVVVADRSLAPPLLGVAERFRGRAVVSRRSRRVVYTFEGVVRAIEFARALAQQDRALRLVVHAGELDYEPDGVGGVAVDAAEWAVGASTAGEVAVTGVAADLALGADLAFRPGPLVTLPGGEGLSLFIPGARPDQVPARRGASSSASS